MLVVVACQHMSLCWVPGTDLGGASPVPWAPLVPGLVLGPLGRARAPKGGRTLPTARMSLDLLLLATRRLLQGLVLDFRPPRLTLALLSVPPKPLW